MNLEEKKKFFGTRFSIRGNIHYTRALFTAAANKAELLKNPNAPKKFSTVLSWNPQDPRNAQTLQAMNAFMQHAKQTFNPQVPNEFYVWPVKEWGKYRRQDGKEPSAFLQGKHWINLSSGEKFRPKVVDTNKQDIIDESVVYSGVEAIVSFSFYPMGEKDATSKKGLGVNIVAVMVLGGGTPDPIGEFNVNLDEVFGEFQNMSAPMGAGYGQQSFNSNSQGMVNSSGAMGTGTQPGQVAPSNYQPQQGYGQAPVQQNVQHQYAAPPGQQNAPQQPAYAPPAAPAQGQPNYNPAPPAQPQQEQQYYNPQQGQNPGWTR